VIENVSTVVHDKSDVVYKTVSSLENLGYSTELITINGVKIGMPQTRKRHFLFACKNPIFKASELLSAFEEYYPVPRPVSWCLELAPRIYDRENTFYAPSYLSDDNHARVKWLLENDEYDLPNHLRPVCHQKVHNYKSVYGRMHWDRPSGTITTGFHSPGRGRYVHPIEARVITSCEAALIQGFPRSYRFYTDNFMPSRHTHAKVIGDAVSPVMSRFFGVGISLNLIGQRMKGQESAVAA
jgi:DNA (cytosine-5)-methyltransferase 1